MKTRVRCHYDNAFLGRSQFYLVEYKTAWFMPWRMLREVFTDIECPPRSDKRFPVLTSFDNACKIASGLTKERLAQLNQERLQAWAKYKADLAKHRQSLPSTKVFNVAP